MIHRRRPPSPAPAPGGAWQLTQPGDLPEPEPATREPPPLKEVINGLDVCELVGQTVFDQLFGPAQDD